MKKENIQQLTIPQHARQRSRSVVGLIYGVIAILLATASWFAWPRSGDNQRILGETGREQRNADATGITKLDETSVMNQRQGVASMQEDVSMIEGQVNIESVSIQESLLTVSGYIINRERIELSPRFIGVVKVINVRKAMPLKKGRLLPPWMMPNIRRKCFKDGVRWNLRKYRFSKRSWT
jgi:hypothetical protein